MNIKEMLDITEQLSAHLVNESGKLLVKKLTPPVDIKHVTSIIVSSHFNSMFTCMELMANDEESQENAKDFKIFLLDYMRNFPTVNSIKIYNK